jgi:CheY-like chemotaxis protein
MRDICLQRLVPFELLDEKTHENVAITNFPFVVGRHSACDWTLDRPQISRRHCAFFLRDEQVCVQDLGSMNGTVVNGTPLRGPQPLQEGDVLSVGGISFEVHNAARAEPPAVKPGAAVPTAPGSDEHQTVLVVDDNEDAARMLAVLLEIWGHEVHVAHNGPQAIKAARAHHPDVVLLDIRLPGMNGYELAQHLRRETGFKPSHMVAITGYQDGDDGQSQKAGIECLLSKPVDPATLRAALSHST